MKKLKRLLRQIFPAHNRDILPKDFVGQIALLYAFMRRHISSIAFFTGFIVDALTLKRIDLLYENTVFISYLTIAFVGILLVHGVETRRFTPRLLVRAKAWLPALVQFPLGGLMSGFVIFYTKSASLFTSWPFIALLFALLVGNEFLRKRYERLIFQIGIFFFALFSYLVLVTPILVGTIGKGTFLLAGVSAFSLMMLLLQIVKYLFDELYARSKKGIWMTVWGVFIGFNVLYFTNAIPPAPLALKEIGIYHSVLRTEGMYEVRYEKPHAYEFWRTTSALYHRTQNEAAYCFTSIFAPTDLRAKVFHSWQRKNSDGTWVRESRIPYTIRGGREAGYRGYTIIPNLPEGDWRCVVETEDRRVIGETRFTVKAVTETPDLAQEIR
jgi:hypothetical protein